MNLSREPLRGGLDGGWPGEQRAGQATAGRGDRALRHRSGTVAFRIAALPWPRAGSSTCWPPWGAIPGTADLECPTTTLSPSRSSRRSSTNPTSLAASATWSMLASGVADSLAGTTMSISISGPALFTPADVFYGRVEQLIATRQAGLDAAYAAHPERFVNGAPTVRRPPAVVAIELARPGDDTAHRQRGARS
jgi:hypothetical protein